MSLNQKLLWFKGLHEESEKTTHEMEEIYENNISDEGLYQEHINNFYNSTTKR